MAERDIPVRRDVNRFQFNKDDGWVRTIITQDEDGFYHVDQTTKTDHLITRRQDIHGNMNARELVNFLSNALFNSCYTGSDAAGKAWMMGDAGKEVGSFR